MEIIKFSYNWNNKLDCRAFTTLRRSNPRKYAQGRLYRIEARRHSFTAECVGVRTIQFSQITDLVAWLDTGYSLPECQEIIRKMYPEVTPLTLFDLILLRRTEEAQPTEVDLPGLTP